MVSGARGADTPPTPRRDKAEGTAGSGRGSSLGSPTLERGVQAEPARAPPLPRRRRTRTLSFMKTPTRGRPSRDPTVPALWSLTALLLTGCSFEPAPPAVAEVAVDHVVASTPENLTWGDYPADKAPVLRVRSGETVRIHTITHAGATQNQDPVEYLTSRGIPREEVLQDVLDFWASREGRERQGRGGHVITGPVYIEGAEPGDVLEIQILDVTTRVPWGINNTAPRGGVFSAAYPGSREGDTGLDIESGTAHVIRTAVVDGREVALFSDDIQIPLYPFMGIMAVAPLNPTVGEPGVSVAGVQGSRPPGPFGGNLDLNDLGRGATLYLPVFHPGALFYVGDGHGVQGDGEVSGTALEQSLTGTFRFVVHKDRSIEGPWAENADYWILMGIDLDLDRAMLKATRAVVDFLVREKGLTTEKAFSFASLAVDFQIAEVVDLTQVVVGNVPKSLFPGP
jgi:acetamidase/formamidase